MPDWRWKLRLFTSADLVGSTAYKQSKSASPAEWAATFKGFFNEYPAAVSDGYAAVPERCPRCEQKLAPWKFSGDEILFHVEVNDHTELVTHLAAFKHAVKNFPARWTEKQIPLQLKATAWLAGFPVNNTELEIPSSTGNTLDFIGPAIDLGFRITKFANPRRFVLSADLALVVLDAIHRTECESRQFQIHLHGRESLKGVIGNEPYPIIWLDMRDGDSDLEEELLGIKPVHLPDKLVSYLRDFLERTPTLMRPFIEGDRDSRYSKIPENMSDLRAQMQAEETDRGYSVPTGEESEGQKPLSIKEPLEIPQIPLSTGPEESPPE